MRSRHYRLIALATSVVVIVLGGCSSTAGLTVGGSSGSGTRWLTRGNELVVRMHASDTGAQTWRVSSFDSMMLRITQTARPSTGADGKRVWIVRFVARTPGNCELELRRIAQGPGGKGEIGERRTFQVWIRDR